MYNSLSITFGILWLLIAPISWDRGSILHGKDLDTGLGLQRTDIFADAAAVADFLNQIRFLYHS